MGKNLNRKRRLQKYLYKKIWENYIRVNKDTKNKKKSFIIFKI